jgi:hypothetical protein
MKASDFSSVQNLAATTMMRKVTDGITAEKKLNGL